SVVTALSKEVTAVFNPIFASWSDRASGNWAPRGAGRGSRRAPGGVGRGLAVVRGGHRGLERAAREPHADAVARRDVGGGADHVSVRPLHDGVPPLERRRR